ncbi:MAG TPA: tRNA pseudouridine(38-40) synthase TruA [Alphaproteobacteria bacterium]|nr:tRNA pseudouridine(38-40) synthase TruA [Alphaproteobacteria bacterium]
MKYKLTLEYDGTGLSGFQKQPGRITTEGLLLEAIKDLTRETPPISISGRTDSGVHGLGQVVSFNLEKELPAYELQNALNHRLKEKPLVIVAAEIVADDFDARFSSKQRFYKYVILNRPIRSVLEKNRVWHIAKKIDVLAMQKAADHLIGTHDFSSFRSSECQSKSPIRTMNEIQVRRAGEYVILNFSARSYLHHMVRNITGTLVDAGLGKINPDELKEILEAKDRRKAKITAPACGLYFTGVEY